MRIACLYLPSLPLQAFLRGAPRWLGAPVALAAAGPRSAPTLVAVSRAAWNLGVRPGTSAMAAHELAPGLHVEPADHRAVRAALRALADSLLSISDVIDLGEPAGAHHAIYVQVPPRTRGATFGARLLDLASAQGLRARVGIADDRFTAYIAASQGEARVPALQGEARVPASQGEARVPALQGEARPSDGDPDAARIVTVPRGGSAAFLAPLPLSLLAISPEVQHVLGALGVRTLGDFANLPPPSTSHPRVAGAPAGSWDADYQALARGDGGDRLVAYEPRDKIVERVAVGGDVSLGAALALTAHRVAARLTGRGLAAVTLLVRSGADTSADALPLPLPAPTADEQDLCDAAAHLVTEGAAFVELEIVTAIATATDAAARAATVTTATAATDGVPRPVDADRSVPLPAPPPFRLTPPDTLASAAREAREPHRRTQRGKHRTRAVVAAQSRLFAGLGARV